MKRGHQECVLLGGIKWDGDEEYHKCHGNACWLEQTFAASAIAVVLSSHWWCIAVAHALALLLLSFAFPLPCFCLLVPLLGQRRAQADLP